MMFKLPASLNKIRRETNRSTAPEFHRFRRDILTLSQKLSSLVSSLLNDNISIEFNSVNNIIDNQSEMEGKFIETLKKDFTHHCEVLFKMFALQMV